jgi:hypothetical protein
LWRVTDEIHFDCFDSFEGLYRSMQNTYILSV